VKRGTLLYLVALSGLVSFLLQAFTGFVLWIAMDRGDGFQGGRMGNVPPGRQEFLSIARESWIDIHDWTAVALLTIIGIHLMLNWRWIVAFTRRGR